MRRPWYFILLYMVLSEGAPGTHVFPDVSLFPEVGKAPSVIPPHTSRFVVSENDQKFIDAFCENPSKAVCEQFPVKDLMGHLTSVTKEVREAALEKLVEKYGKASVETLKSAHGLGFALSTLKFFDPKNGILDKQEKHLAYFLKTVETIASEQLGEPVTNSGKLFKELMPSLEQALRNQIVERTDRNELLNSAKAALGQVKFYTPSEYLKAGGAPINITAFCGKDLLSYNAFFVRNDVAEEEAVKGGDGGKEELAKKKGLEPEDNKVDEAKKITAVVVCPGVWLAAIAAKRCAEAPTSYLADSLTSTLSHELGHRIDYGRVRDAKGDPTPYDEFGKCIHENLLKRGTLREFLNDDFSEITADYWSAETLAAMVTQGRITRADLVRILRYSSTPYCNSIPQPNDPHPPGKFRVDLKGRNPRIRAALRCSADSARRAPLCALEGHVNAPPEGRTRPKGFTLQR